LHQLLIPVTFYTEFEVSSGGVGGNQLKDVEYRAQEPDNNKNNSNDQCYVYQAAQYFKNEPAQQP
jgi:hypothetical protein